jgi:hypothetical protein
MEFSDTSKFMVLLFWKLLSGSVMFSDYRIFYYRLRHYAIQAQYVTGLTMSLRAQSATAVLLYKNDCFSEILLQSQEVIALWGTLFVAGILKQFPRRT